MTDRKWDDTGFGSADIAIVMPIAPDFAEDAPYRIDDRVRTAIAGLSGDIAARGAAWRQMIDLLCQPGTAGDNADMLIDAVIGAHPDIPIDIRREAARVAAFGAPPAALVVHISQATMNKEEQLFGFE